ncbi:retrotransposon-related protein [Tanacetum coccineum]
MPIFLRSRQELTSSDLYHKKKDWLYQNDTDPKENKLLQKIGDMGSFIKWFCKRIGKKKLNKLDLEGPAHNVVKGFLKNNISNPLPLGGPPEINAFIRPLEREAREYGDYLCFNVLEICDELRKKNPDLFDEIKPKDIAMEISRELKLENTDKISRHSIQLHDIGVISFMLQRSGNEDVLRGIYTCVTSNYMKAKQKVFDILDEGISPSTNISSELETIKKYERFYNADIIVYITPDLQQEPHCNLCLLSMLWIPMFQKEPRRRALWSVVALSLSVIEKACVGLVPNFVCEYLFVISKLFTSCYSKASLNYQLLCKTALVVMDKRFDLLGISPGEEIMSSILSSSVEHGPCRELVEARFRARTEIVITKFAMSHMLKASQIFGPDKEKRSLGHFSLRVKLASQIIAYYRDGLVKDDGGILVVAVPVDGCLMIEAFLMDVKTNKVIVDDMIEYHLEVACKTLCDRDRNGGKEVKGCCKLDASSTKNPHTLEVVLLSRYYLQGSYQLVLSLRVLIERASDSRSLSRELDFCHHRVFSLISTPADQWLKIVGLNLEVAVVEWFQWMTRNGLISTWARFEESARNCFGPSEYEDLNGALSKLLQLETVKDYQWEFEKLMNRARDIPDSLLISFYISALELYLKREFLARLDDQAAPMAGTMAKTFGNNGGDELESSGPVTPTEKDDLSFAEEKSYLSGYQYFLSKQILMDEDMDELNLLCPDFVLKEFISQTDEFIITEGQVLGKTSMVHMDDFCIDEDQHGSVRSIGVAINSDVADFGSNVPDNGSLGVYELWKLSFMFHIKTIMWFKKESMVIPRRLWDLRIKIFFRHHLEDKVDVKEWGMIHPRLWIIS